MHFGIKCFAFLSRIGTGISGLIAPCIYTAGDISGVYPLVAVVEVVPAVIPWTVVAVEVTVVCWVPVVMISVIVVPVVRTPWVPVGRVITPVP